MEVHHDLNYEPIPQKFTGVENYVNKSCKWKFNLQVSSEYYYYIDQALSGNFNQNGASIYPPNFFHSSGIST